MPARSPRLEQLAHVLLRGAVDPRIGDRAFPLAQVIVLGGQRFEAPSAQAVALHVGHAPFHLALVSGRSRPGGQNRDVVMPAELHDLRVQLRIVPVGLADHGLGIVEDNRLGHSPQGPKRILQGTNE